MSRLFSAFWGEIHFKCSPFSAREYLQESIKCLHEQAKLGWACLEEAKKEKVMLDLTTEPHMLLRQEAKNVSNYNKTAKENEDISLISERDENSINHDIMCNKSIANKCIADELKESCAIAKLIRIVEVT